MKVKDKELEETENEELISFDTFCDEAKIYGNFREAFFHSLRAKNLDNNLTRVKYKEYWNELLTTMLQKK